MSLTATKSLKAPTPVHDQIVDDKRQFCTTANALLRAYQIAFARYSTHECRTMVTQAETEFPPGRGGRGNIRRRRAAKRRPGD